MKGSGLGVVVYVVSRHFDYEGGEVEGVYADKDSAEMAVYARDPSELKWESVGDMRWDADTHGGWWRIEQLPVIP